MRAAERTSDLVPALSRYVAYQTQLEAIRRRVANASIYPALLIGVGGLVTLFLMLYVVPRFGKIYEERSTDLPLFSQLLIAWGQLVQGHAVLVLGVVAAAVAAVRAGAAPGDACAPRLAMRCGASRRSASASRSTSSRASIAPPACCSRAACRWSARSAWRAELLHPVLRERLAAASRAISEGHPVSESLDANGLATPVALRMLAVGDRSGSMGEMMERIAGFHDEELARWVDWFTRMFEPLLMALHRPGDRRDRGAHVHADLRAGGEPAMIEAR